MEQMEYLDFKTEEERHTFVDAIVSILKTSEVMEAIAKNKLKNCGFRIKIRLDSLVKCGLDPLVELHNLYHKKRNDLQSLR